MMRADGQDIGDVVALLGGQGTINVNSWAPDSERLAFVAYPEGRERQVVRSARRCSMSISSRLTPRSRERSESGNIGSAPH